MRLAISGAHRSAQELREQFRHPTVGWRTESIYPDVRLIVDSSKGTNLELSCSDSQLEALILDQLEELEVRTVVVSRPQDKTKAVTLKMPGGPWPNASWQEAQEVAVEKAVFRALLLYARARPSLAEPVPERPRGFWGWVAKRLHLLGLLFLCLPPCSALAESNLVQRATIHSVLLQPTNLVPFKVDLARVGGTDLLGAQVVDQANAAFRVNVVAGGAGGGIAQLQVRSAANAWTDVGFFGGNLNVPVNCVVGCSGSSFLDAGAFTFGTTPVSLSAFVVDDVATNTVAEDSAGAGRMSTNRIPYFSLHSDAGTALLGQKQMSGSIPVVVASDQSELKVGINAGSGNGTLNALNAVAAIGVAASLGGTVSVHLLAGTLAGTIVPECSYDSTTYVTGWFFDPATTALSQSLVVTNPSPVADLVILCSGGAWTERVRVSSYTSGTATATIVQTTTAYGFGFTNLRNAAGTEIATAGAPLRIDPTGSTTQPVSGTVTANAGTGTFIVGQGSGANLHVNVDSAPTTTVTGTVTANQGGAPWTARIQDGAGAPLATVTAGNALKIDGSAVTQPVSGTVTANAGTGTFTVSGTVTANAGTNLNTSALALDATVGRAQASATSGQTGPLVQGAVTTAAPTYTTGQTDPLSLTTAGGLRVDGSGVTQPVSGTVTTSPPSNASTNVAQFGGTNVSTGTGAGGAGIPRVTISNDSSLAANQSVNVAQVAGTTTSVNAGNPDAGSQRVVAAQNTTASGNNSSCVSVTTASTGILTSFSTARCRILFARETNTDIVYVKLGATATSSNFPMPPNSALNLCSGQIYTGAIDGIAATGTQSICVVEF